MRPNDAEITTVGGIYHITPPVCDIELNKIYHVAMVYDGVSLKFYRNGFLLSQTPVSGNLFQNDFPTQIGLYNAALYNTNLIGYINEVRIWNVARTQAEIQACMNTSLPSPAVMKLCLISRFIAGGGKKYLKQKTLLIAGMKLFRDSNKTRAPFYISLKPILFAGILPGTEH